MTERRDRGRWGRDDSGPPRRPEPRRDAGAYIGRMPERQADTQPEGRREGATATDDKPKDAGQNR